MACSSETKGMPLMALFLAIAPTWVLSGSPQGISSMGIPGWRVKDGSSMRQCQQARCQERQQRTQREAEDERRNKKTALLSNLYFVKLVSVYAGQSC